MAHSPLIKARQDWRKWVNTDHGLAALLLVLVAYGFIIYPLTCAKETTNPLAASAFSVVLVLGVLATTRHKGMRMGMVTLAVFAFTSRWLHLLIQAHAVHVIAASASILFFSVLLYFSFTTLTTLGVGDILPIHPIARSLTTLEALVGQLYPAVLLARLVTLYHK